MEAAHQVRPAAVTVGGRVQLVAPPNAMPQPAPCWNVASRWACLHERHNLISPQPCVWLHLACSSKPESACLAMPQVVMLWLWLSYRFDAEVFPQRDKVGPQLSLDFSPCNPIAGKQPAVAGTLPALHGV